MNYDVLARRLQSWLAPEDLVAAARALAQDREAAFEQTSLALSASVLTSSQDGGLRTMCEEFVKRFEVPGNVIRFLRNSIIEKHGDLDWDALERLRFEGRVASPIAPVPQGNATLEVFERSVVLDLLAQPLKGLQGMIATSAQAWIEAGTLEIPRESFWHQHRASEPFLVWLDAEVGHVFGFTSIGKCPASIGPILKYRAITVGDFHAANGKLLQIIKDMSIKQAAETWHPI